MKYIIANWKSNKTLQEAMEWVSLFPKKKLQNTIVLCPPFPFITPIAEKIISLHLPLELGTQNLSAFPAGAYTGEVTTRNLEHMNVSFAILGHSERRMYFHETNQDVANKVSLALTSGITPIVCVDEDNVLAQSNAIEDEDRKRCIVAFEPQGHIGTGEPDSLEHILSVAKKVETAFGSVPFLYGGSVHKATADEFMKQQSIHGLLVGGLSLDLSKFLELIAVSE